MNSEPMNALENAVEPEAMAVQREALALQREADQLPAVQAASASTLQDLHAAAQHVVQVCEGLQRTFEVDSPPRAFVDQVRLQMEKAAKDVRAQTAQAAAPEPSPDSGK